MSTNDLITNKIITIDDCIILPCDCPKISNIVDITFDPKITIERVIITPSSDCLKNSRCETLTGNALIIEGLIITNIKYTTGDSMPTINYIAKIPFITSIPKSNTSDICKCSHKKILVISKYFSKITSRKMSVSLSLEIL